MYCTWQPTSKIPEQFLLARQESDWRVKTCLIISINSNNFSSHNVNPWKLSWTQGTYLQLSPVRKSTKPSHNLFHNSPIVSKNPCMLVLGGWNGICDPLSKTVAVVVNWHSARSTSPKSESFSIAANKCNQHRELNGLINKTPSLMYSTCTRTEIICSLITWWVQLECSSNKFVWLHYVKLFLKTMKYVKLYFYCSMYIIDSWFA